MPANFHLNLFYDIIILIIKYISQYNSVLHNLLSFLLLETITESKLKFLWFRVSKLNKAKY